MTGRKNARVGKREKLGAVIKYDISYQNAIDLKDSVFVFITNLLFGVCLQGCVCLTLQMKQMV